jgi:hypothetical protein
MALRVALVFAIATTLVAPASAAAQPAWLTKAKIVVPGNLDNEDCRTGVCKHNENTDLTVWNGAIWFVHRTASSQVLGPNSSLRVYRSTNDGRSFSLQAIIPAPDDRDIRDPSFYIVRNRLFIKAITRLPGFGLRDTGVASVSVETSSRDGRRWAPAHAISPEGWGFWRVVERDGRYYSAAYADGDLRVVLYSSRNGVAWTAGPEIYGVSEDTPLETELIFSPSGKHMLGLVRMDGNDFELLGSQGRLRTKICWATKPYASWSCPDEFTGVRLDGAVAFYWGRRLFVIARKHIPSGDDYRKRTALYEITGNLEGGPIYIKEWGDLPSAGDTSYAGVAPLGGSEFLVTWYSSPIAGDPSWLEGFGGQTDIWQATLDLAELPRHAMAPGTTE